MHVERFGHGGLPVVLLHGFGTSSFLWRNVAPVLAVHRHTAYALDLFGHGESDRPFDADFGIAAQGEYLDRALTALRIPHAVIVGVDLGAAVALRLAAFRPEVVTRLVVINPFALDSVPGREVKALQRSTARHAVRISHGLLGASVLLAPLLNGSVADGSHMPPILVGRYLAPFVGREGVDHLLALARAIRPEDMDEVDLGEIAAPTLVLWGEEEQWLDRGLPNKLINAIPDSRLIRVPGAGRLLPEENPTHLSEVIVDFAANRVA